MSLSGHDTKRSLELVEALRLYAAEFPRIELADHGGADATVSVYRGTKALREHCEAYLRATGPLLNELTEISLRAMPAHLANAARRKGPNI